MPSAATLAQWPHTTADAYLEEPIGIDLFDADPPGHFAIYARFPDGTRWPCRTVWTGDPAHAASVLAAWSERGEVHDYRTAASTAPAAPKRRRKPVPA